MLRYEDDCVCCDLPCINCGRKHAPHWYCDECEDELDPDDLYDFDGEMLCENCLLNRFPKISV